VLALPNGSFGAALQFGSPVELNAITRPEPLDQPGSVPAPFAFLPRASYVRFGNFSVMEAAIAASLLETSAVTCAAWACCSRVLRTCVGESESSCFRRLRPIDWERGGKRQSGGRKDHRAEEDAENGTRVQ
jgi:hypothetical protein